MDRETIQGIRTTKCLDEKLLACKGVIGVDVDYKQVKGQKTDTFSIIVYVKKKISQEELSAEEAVPARIEGIPTDVVECPNVWPSNESSAQRATEVTTKQVKSFVLEGGQSISNQRNLGHYGTLAIVLMGSVPTAWSCAHVMVYPPPQLGQAVIEPGGPQGGEYPLDSIGHTAMAYYGVNNLDAALCPIQGRSSEMGSILNIGNCPGFFNAFVGQKVKKMGARTGVTEGFISSITCTWQLRSDLGTVTLYNQIRIDGHFALGGDSGAAVIETTNNGMVGMVVSGSDQIPFFTICNNSADLANIQPIMAFSHEQE